MFNPVLFGAAMLLLRIIRLFAISKGNIEAKFSTPDTVLLFESISIGLVRAVIAGVLLALYAIGFIRPAVWQMILPIQKPILMLHGKERPHDERQRMPILCRSECWLRNDCQCFVSR